MGCPPNDWWMFGFAMIGMLTVCGLVIGGLISILEG